MKVQNLFKMVCCSGFIILVSQNSHSQDFSFNGTFSNPNQVQYIDFSIKSPELVYAETYSYAGGTDQAGQTFSNGGFDPVLAIIDSKGNVIAKDDDGKFWVTDFDNGKAYDSFIHKELEAGEYQLAISQTGNMPDEGEPAVFEGDFPGDLTDFDGRTPQWALDIFEVDFASLGKVLFGEKEQYIVQQTAMVENSSQASLRQQISTLNYAVVNQFKLMRDKQSGQFTVQNADHSLNSGLNAGDGTSGLAVWFTPVYTSLNNTQSKDKGYRFDESDQSYLFGVDYVVSTEMVFGALLGYERSKADMKNDGDLDKQGGVVSVYGAYNLSSKTTFYTQAGYGKANTDVTDMSRGIKVSGDFDSDKTFIGLGAIYSSPLQHDFWLTLDGAFNYSQENLDSYTDSTDSRIDLGNTYLGLLTFNAEFAKTISYGEAYIKTGVEIQTTDQSNSLDTKYDYNRYGGIAGVGLRFNATDDLTGDIYANANILRKYEDSGYTLGASLRYQF